MAEKKQLVPVALNMHGTRAVQKLIETLSSREQREIVIDALRDGKGNECPRGKVQNMPSISQGCRCGA